MKAWTWKVPLVLVPTAYPQPSVKKLIELQGDEAMRELEERFLR